VTSQSEKNRMNEMKKTAKIRAITRQWISNRSGSMLLKTKERATAHPSIFGGFSLRAIHRGVEDRN
jgi:hypothetical protein